MGEKWVDEGITTRTNRTPAQRERDMRDAEADTVKLNEAGLILLERRIAEQSAIIVGQRAAIEALRGWIQEQADGISNLGMRATKLEDGFAEFKTRVIAAYPLAGKPTMQKMCDDVEFRGPIERGEG